MKAVNHPLTDTQQKYEKGIIPANLPLKSQNINIFNNKSIM
jgi:hypothetical protein